ncbi:MAG: RNA polymerase sigma factor [Terriglobales bacterium]
MADDRVLWELICQRDARAFGAFYQENAPRLLAFLRHAVGNRQAAEDIMQEAFIHIWSRPNGFRPERGTLRAYLYGIGRNRAGEWWRNQDPRSVGLDNNLAVTQTDSISIRDAFGRLPEEQRTLLWLREVEGQSYAELAQILKIPVGTVKSRLFAAREDLRIIWKGALPERKEGI